MTTNMSCACSQENTEISVTGAFISCSWTIYSVWLQLVYEMHLVAACGVWILPGPQEQSAIVHHLIQAG